MSGLQDLLIAPAQRAQSVDSFLRAGRLAGQANGKIEQAPSRLVEIGLPVVGLDLFGQ